MASSTTLHVAPLGEEQDDQPQKSRIASFCRSLAVGLAAVAWLKISLNRPASLFCSATVATTSVPAPVQTVASSAWAGLAAGCLHSLSGPDHLAALTPLTLGISSVKASLLGAWWGFGHCIGQLILGLLMLLLKDRFNNMLPMLDKYAALAIGFTLITIGALGLYESFGAAAEAAPEAAAGSAAEIPQASPALRTAGGPPITVGPPSAESTPDPLPPSAPARKSKGFSIWTLATGIVYGLQPDALFVVIPALALPTKLAAASYMAMFVVGTVTAMGSYTAFIGATSNAMGSKSRFFKVENLSAFASLIALLMGTAVVFGYGLPFLGHAHPA